MTFGLGEFADFLNKSGECFPEIAESKPPLDAVGIVSQLPIGRLCLKALGFITRERRDATATGRANSMGQARGHYLRRADMERDAAPCHGSVSRMILADP